MKKNKNNNLSILHISTIWVPISPEITYGGTERVIYYLNNELTNRGYESIIAAPADSKVNGKLLPTLKKSVWGPTAKLRSTRRESMYYKIHYEAIFNFLTNNKIDIIHDHPGDSILSSIEYDKYKNKIDTPILTTIHQGPLEKHNVKYKKWNQLIKDGKKIYFNAISHSHKKDFESVWKNHRFDSINICDVIYHGIPLDLFPFNNKKEDYLFSLGRIDLDKGQHIAIEIAKKIGMKLIIAGEVHTKNMPYYKEMIEPYIDNDQIKFIGPLNDKQKAEFYKNALAFLMPIQWNEPFGLVYIESMACGTPVVTYDRGSASEIIKDNETGFVIKETGDKKYDLEQMVKAVKNIESIKPKNCRKRVEENFTIEKEAENYLKLYKKIIN